MTTAAKTVSTEGSHYYTLTGEPAYEVPGKDGTPRKTTVADARKLGLLPSTTTILGCLNKPALTSWLIENACLSVLTTPRAATEDLDSFVHRVLHVERHQDKEADAAKKLGTEIHSLLEEAFAQIAQLTSPTWEWCSGAYEAISRRGKVIAVERCVVGDGYAGRVDLIQDNGTEIWIWDYKTTKKLPKQAYNEHILQASSYAAALSKEYPGRTIRTGNVYISTVEKGKFAVAEHGDWKQTYEQAFAPLVKVWQFLNNYTPHQNN